jgi:tetratricopeptide (TPR) repeat protein
MGTAMTSGMVKAKNAFIAPFTKGASTDDPTSLASMPTNLGPEIWVTNGQLYESQGNFAKAQENYSKALEVEPSNEAALLSVARLHSRQQQFAEAEVVFQKALAINPQAAILNEMALAQQKQGKTAEAQNSVQRAISMDPQNARYRNNLAGMLVATGRSDEAVQQLEQVFPSAVANYNVAYLHFNNKNVPAAQQHLQLALQQDPNLKPARDLMNQLGGSGTVQSAMTAYGTAAQIYRTAESIASPTIQASSAVYQPGQPGQFSQTNQPAAGTGLPATPASVQPGNLSAAMGYPSAGYAAPVVPASQVPPASYPTTLYPPGSNR